MIEVNRKLYIDEGTGEKSTGYDKVESDLASILSDLSI